MDFRIPDELAALRKSFAAFVDREVRPLDESLREDYATIHPDVERVRDALDKVRRRWKGRSGSCSAVCRARVTNCSSARAARCSRAARRPCRICSTS